MICVDSNKQVMQLGNDCVQLRKNAEEKKELCHFCEIDTLKSILLSEALLLNNLHNFVRESSYEKIGIDEKFWGCVFLSCMTHGKNELWNTFGDAGYGVKLKFIYNGIFHEEVFDRNKKAKAYSKNEELLYEFGFSSSKIGEIGCCSNFNTGVIVDLIVSDVRYLENMQQSTLSISNGKMLNLSNVSRTVLNKFNKEEETRIIGILRSVKSIELQDISYLLMPLNFGNFTLGIEYGKFVTNKQKEEIHDLWKNVKKL